MLHIACYRVGLGFSVSGFGFSVLHIASYKVGRNHRLAYLAGHVPQMSSVLMKMTRKIS